VTVLVASLFVSSSSAIALSGSAVTLYAMSPVTPLGMA